VYAASESRMKRSYAVTGVALSITRDSAQLERGRHLATALAKCTDCHGEDLGGRPFFEDPVMGLLYASNLTAGRGGILARYDDRQLEAAIRHGVNPEGRALVYMPSQEYQHLGDEDVAAIIAYLRSLPPVDREGFAPRLGPMGRVLLVTGKMKLLPAEMIDHGAARPSVPPAGATVEYGEYLSRFGGCFGCHGPDLAGGVPNGPPGSPVPSNITPAGIGSWSEADWFTAMRTGVRPDGTELTDFMPWRLMASMSDDELRAMWLYLRTVPPAGKATGS
jgi:mono/diheme cytochrome c family protein